MFKEKMRPHCNCNAPALRLLCDRNAIKENKIKEKNNKTMVKGGLKILNLKFPSNWPRKLKKNYQNRPLTKGFLIL